MVEIRLDRYVTERRNPNTFNLDEMNTLEILSVMNVEDAKVPLAIKDNLDAIGALVDEVVRVFANGGRLIYIGAGTSGRLGVLDASECVPTFGVSPNQVIGIIAGGDTALRTPIENSEDDLELAQKDLEKILLNHKDIVVGLAASGRTPYVIGGLNYAKSIGCKTGSVSCNLGSEVGKLADYPIEVEAGPEVLTGSTRLKSGTIQKLVLNMITTASMVLSGKAYQNLMVDVQMSNKKLEVRGQNIVMEATGISRDEAILAIESADNDIKLAIVMILSELEFHEAKTLLEKHGGHVKKAIHAKIKETI